jgi:hypothetical protein
MYGGMHAYFRSLSHMGAMKNGGTGRDEDLRPQHRARDMGVRADEAMISDDAGMARARPHHRILHHDAILPDPDRTSSFTDDARAMHHPGTGADRYITAYRRIGRDPGGWIDLWGFACMLDQHRSFPFLEACLSEEFPCRRALRQTLLIFAPIESIPV